jgi:tRNA G18 (ribose-2'-O)-methylase SpoU
MDAIQDVNNSAINDTLSSSTLNHPIKSNSRHHCYPPSYLIITNISKRQNIRKLLQIAVAYGVQTIFVVGQKQFEFELVDGSDIPAMLHDVIRRGQLKIVKFDKLQECIAYIKSIPNDNPNDDVVEEKNVETAAHVPVRILGVEIDESSLNLEYDDPFSTLSLSSRGGGGVAFMMGNEGSGMTTKQMSHCDGFIRISQYGGGMACLNVSVAAGIVLHRYFHWARDVI